MHALFLSLLWLFLFPAGPSPSREETSDPSGWRSRVLALADAKVQNMVYGKVGAASAATLILVTADGRCLEIVGPELDDPEVRTLFSTRLGLNAVALGDTDPHTEGLEVLVTDGTGRILRPEPGLGSIGFEIFYEGDIFADYILAGNLDPVHPGDEVLAFSNDGYLLVIRSEKTDVDGITRKVEIAGRDEARLRHALIGPFADDGGPAALVAGTRGTLFRLRLEDKDWIFEELYRHKAPLARIAVHGGPSSGLPVLVAADDEGGVTRLERCGDDYTGKLLFKESRPIRGLVTADWVPDVEGPEIAVYGYGMEIALHTLRPDGPSRTTLYRDTDRGHWLCAIPGPTGHPPALVSGGYSGKVVLLKRRSP